MSRSIVVDGCQIVSKHDWTSRWHLGKVHSTSQLTTVYALALVLVEGAASDKHVDSDGSAFN